MIRIEEPVQLAAAPFRPKWQPNLEDSGHSAKDPKRQ